MQDLCLLPGPVNKSACFSKPGLFCGVIHLDMNHTSHSIENFEATSRFRLSQPWSNSFIKHFHPKSFIKHFTSTISDLATWVALLHLQAAAAVRLFGAGLCDWCWVVRLQEGPHAYRFVEYPMVRNQSTGQVHRNTSLDAAVPYGAYAANLRPWYLQAEAAADTPAFMVSDVYHQFGALSFADPYLVITFSVCTPCTYYIPACCSCCGG